MYKFLFNTANFRLSDLLPVAWGNETKKKKSNRLTLILDILRIEFNGG